MFKLEPISCCSRHDECSKVQRCVVSETTSPEFALEYSATVEEIAAEYEKMCALAKRLTENTKHPKPSNPYDLFADDNQQLKLGC
ncbi:MAG: hypothetical protein ACYCX4_00120 [Bacillota bacterium]